MPADPAEGTTMTEVDGMADDASGPAERRAIGRLFAAQTDPRERWALTLATTVVGLALAAVHWSGLLAGGALVGLCWPTFRRALVAGFGFGVAVLAAAGVRFALAGRLTEVFATWPLVGIAVAVPLVAGPLGATVRGLVPDMPTQPSGGD
jgi:hypothetical protein